MMIPIDIDLSPEPKSQCVACKALFIPPNLPQRVDSVALMGRSKDLQAIAFSVAIWLWYLKVAEKTSNAKKLDNNDHWICGNCLDQTYRSLVPRFFPLATFDPDKDFSFLSLYAQNNLRFE